MSKDFFRGTKLLVFSAVLIVLALMSACATVAPRYADNKSIETVVQPNSDIGEMAWNDCWWGAGTGSTAVTRGQNLLPIADDQDLLLKDVQKDWFVVFRDSAPGSKDSLDFRYYFKEGGGWTWCAFGARGWANIDVSKSDALMISVKGKTGKETLDFQLDTPDGKNSGSVVVMPYLPEGKITLEWQTAIIPFSMEAGISGLDLSKGLKGMDFRALGQVSGDYELWVDNVIFVNTKTTPMDDKVKENMAIMQDPESVLDREVTFDFESGPMGFVPLAGEENMAQVTGVNAAEIGATKIPAGQREGFGRNVLVVKLHLEGGKGHWFAIQNVSSHNWSKYKMFGVNIWLPPDAPKGIVPGPFAQYVSEVKEFDWKQPQGKGELIPGRWNKVIYDLSSFPGLVLDKIQAQGWWFWVDQKNVESTWDGEIYLDDVFMLGKKDFKVTLLPAADYAAFRQTFTPVDISKLADRGFGRKKVEGVVQWTGEEENTLAEFPFKGRTEFFGVPFDILDEDKNGGKTCIFAHSPGKVEIPVGSTAAAVYILHCHAWGGGIVAKYTFVYEDGTSRTKEIADGEDIFNWWGRHSAPYCRSVWSGYSVTSRDIDTKVNVYLYPLSNPSPAKKIVKLVVEPQANASLFILGLTLADKAAVLPEQK